MDVQFIENKLSRRPYSPLFARLANEYLSSGEIDKALELCSSGIERYPHYSTAYLIRAKCFAAKQDYVSALQNLKNVLEAFPDSTLPRKYEQEWNELTIRNQITGTITHVEVIPEEAAVEIPPQENTFVSPVESIPEEKPSASGVSEEAVVLPAPVPEDVPPLVPVIEPVTPEISENLIEKQSLQTIAAEPRKRELEQPSTRTVIDGERIVSKTLAEIYAKQGEYDEAIMTYRLLQEKRPNEAGEFARRIRELEEKKSLKQE